jgi:hypothetical protein
MAGRRDFDTDEADHLQDVGKYCETVLLHRADESDNGEFFPDLIRQFADLGLLLELMFDEQRNLQLHRMRLVHQTTELVAAAFPAAVVALAPSDYKPIYSSGTPNPTSQTGTLSRCSAANSTDRSESPNRTQGRTSGRSRPWPPATVTAGSSTAARNGPASPPMPRSTWCWPNSIMTAATLRPSPWSSTWNQTA